MSIRTELNSPFMIGNVLLPNRCLLAPMDGYTDSPFRRICRNFGASLNTSEFINGIDIAFGHPHLKTLTYFTEDERPFCYQIFDDNPDRLLQSALKLEQRSPDIIDINMGCSAKNVSNRGAGAGLLKQPQKIHQIASSLVDALSLPVTAKIRLGWDDSTRNYLEVAAILVDCGISAITVLARTRQQAYTGSADWDAIAEVKSSVPIPVIGNGDVLSLADAQRMREHTACDAVMIGRAAIGNPWIFSGSDRSLVTREELLNVISDHLLLMVELYTERTGTVLFRKHLSKYLSGHLPTIESRQKVFSIDNSAELMMTVKNMLLG